MDKEHVRVKDDHCPKCKSFLDSSTHIDGDERPSPHDVSICFKCATYLEFDDDLTLIRLSTERFNELEIYTQVKLMLIQKEIHKFRQQFN